MIKQTEHTQEWTEEYVTEISRSTPFVTSSLMDSETSWQACRDFCKRYPYLKITPYGIYCRNINKAPFGLLAWLNADLVRCSAFQIVNLYTWETIARFGREGSTWSFKQLIKGQVGGRTLLWANGGIQPWKKSHTQGRRPIEYYHLGVAHYILLQFLLVVFYTTILAAYTMFVMNNIFVLASSFALFHYLMNKYYCNSLPWSSPETKPEWWNDIDSEVLSYNRDEHVKHVIYSAIFTNLMAIYLIFYLGTKMNHVSDAG